MKKHSCNLHAPLCGIFCPNSVVVARYDALIWTKSPTNCDAYLAESLFQTRSSESTITQTSSAHQQYLLYTIRACTGFDGGFEVVEAIRQAKKARALEEVPIGCVIVCDGQIIARGYNRRNTDKNTLSHAELNAIKKASKKLGDWRLEGCTMYVTLEPCQMCAGALMQSRIDRVVIGSMNPKAGCAGSVLNLLEMDGFNHKVEVIRGVLQEECSSMLSDFFKELREKKKMLKKSLAEQVGNSEK